jgi:hypothetical protein
MEGTEVLEVLAAIPTWVVVAPVALVAAAVGGRWVTRRLAAVVGSHEKLTGGHLAATAAVLAAAVALIALAFAMSYASLYESATWLASTPFGDLRWMFPIGIDAVIVYFLALDLLMEWQGRRSPLARWSAYALSAVTIVLNVSQTGHQAGLAEALGHAGPPLVIILISEGVAAWIRHMAGMLHDDLPDRIPAGRWIAHPVSTVLVVRLMLGWGITSYDEALAKERRRQYAIAMLREQFGRRWRRRTPRHVVWMLTNGHDLERAYALVDRLTPQVVTDVGEAPIPGAGDASHERPVKAGRRVAAASSERRAAPSHEPGAASPERRGAGARGGSHEPQAASFEGAVAAPHEAASHEQVRWSAAEVRTNTEPSHEAAPAEVGPAVRAKALSARTQARPGGLRAPRTKDRSPRQMSDVEVAGRIRELVRTGVLSRRPSVNEVAKATGCSWARARRVLTNEDTSVETLALVGAEEGSQEDDEEAA